MVTLIPSLRFRKIILAHSRIHRDPVGLRIVVVSRITFFFTLGI